MILSIKTEISDKIIDTIKDKVYDIFNNQAERLIKIKEVYYKWNTLHCDIHNNFYLDNDIKLAFLKNLERKNPMQDLLKGEQNYIRWESPEKIKQNYRKKANKFLENISQYVETRLEGENIISIENLHINLNSGAWKINGNKLFEFRPIYAGGYNIQCLHIRIIYSYKRLT